LDTISIEDADILVSVGRGIGNKENLELVHELAREIGGNVSSSRALVELGWTVHPIQVGQSGKTVNPKIYIALGISGAIQHLVGMQSSDIIIAINSDPDAPIFKVADFGIIGDIHEIIPQFLKQIRSNRKTD
jgi:electron transfer flavoprotein alpha subunit